MSAVCRVCLAVDVQLFRISGPLQMVFESITSTELYTTDGRPVVACYICYAQLNKCRKLMLTSARAENVLNAIVHSHSKITVKSVSRFDRQANGLCGSLTCSRAECFDITPDSADVKAETKSDIGSDGLDGSLQPPALADIQNMKIDYEEVTNIYDIKVEPIEEYQLSRCSSAIDLKEDIVYEEGDLSAQTSGYYKWQPAEESKSKRKPSKSQHKQKQTDRGPHQCKICLREFKQKCHLSRHLKAHNDEKPFKCTICKRSYFRKDVLLNHIKKLHGEKPNKSVQNSEKRFKCEFCQRRFSRKDNLTIHVRTHSGDRPFECDLCMRRFIHKSNIISHLRVHTGEKPYECYICYHRFYRKDHLQNHIVNHLICSDEKPYSATQKS